MLNPYTSQTVLYSCFRFFIHLLSCSHIILIGPHSFTFFDLSLLSLDNLECLLLLYPLLICWVCLMAFFFLLPTGSVFGSHFSSPNFHVDSRYLECLFQSSRQNEGGQRRTSPMCLQFNFPYFLWSLDGFIFPVGDSLPSWSFLTISFLPNSL